MELTFQHVDGLATHAAKGELKQASLNGMHLRAKHLGPLVELANLIASNQLPDWVIGEHVESFGGAALVGAIINGAKPQSVRNGDRIGVCSLKGLSDGFDTSFNLAARKAAESSGFSNNTAAQFGAALRELKSNVVDHSLATDTGVLFYSAGERWFEFGVTDRGQGVLNSLRSWPDYAHLENHGDALRLAVSDGGTRYGPGTMHGNGFRPIFQGLAGYRGYLRWRSGDHALVIDGRDPNAGSGALIQKPQFSGLTLSVRCGLE